MLFAQNSFIWSPEEPLYRYRLDSLSERDPPLTRWGVPATPEPAILGNAHLRNPVAVFHFYEDYNEKILILNNLRYIFF